jgi:hypothetical protein
MRTDLYAPVEKLAAFLQLNEGRWAPAYARSRDAAVIAIIELRETRRKWFIIGAEVHDGRHVLIGYEPRCRYHAPGDGWFALASDFFIRAAHATGDQLDVHTMTSAMPVADLDVDDGF